MPKCDVAAIKSLNVRFINGFSNITTGAEVGSLMSATHDDPDSVSNENGPDFSILNGICIGVEMDHLFCLALLLFLHLKYKTAAATATTAADEASDVARITVFRFLDLGLCSLMGLRFLS